MQSFIHVLNSATLGWTAIEGMAWHEWVISRRWKCGPQNVTHTHTYLLLNCFAETKNICIFYHFPHWDFTGSQNLSPWKTLARLSYTVNSCWSLGDAIEFSLLKHQNNLSSTPGDPLLTWFILIPAWISNHMSSKVWDENTYPPLKFGNR